MSGEHHQHLDLGLTDPIEFSAPDSEIDKRFPTLMARCSGKNLTCRSATGYNILEPAENHAVGRCGIVTLCGMTVASREEVCDLGLSLGERFNLRSTTHRCAF